MRSMPSTPFIFSSSGPATVFMSSTAFAPGYVHDTEMEGRASVGYIAIGIRIAARTPATTVTVATTAANLGLEASASETFTGPPP